MLVVEYSPRYFGWSKQVIDIALIEATDSLSEYIQYICSKHRTQTTPVINTY